MLFESVKGHWVFIRIRSTDEVYRKSNAPLITKLFHVQLTEYSVTAQ